MRACHRPKASKVGIGVLVVQRLIRRGMSVGKNIGVRVVCFSKWPYSDLVSATTCRSSLSLAGAVAPVGGSGPGTIRDMTARLLAGAGPGTAALLGLFREAFSTCLLLALTAFTT